MFARICLILQLLVAMSAWAQVDMNVIEPGTDTPDQAQMLTPPPVSGDAYPAMIGSEARSNYLRTGWTITTAYSDNVLGEVGANPISDISYSLWPSIAIDKATSRLHLMLIYSPGFTIYQHTSGLNQTDQNVASNFQYRLSPHVTASFRESFLKSSNVFNQPDPLSAVVVSGSAQPSSVAVVVASANQLSNMTNAELTYQFSRNGMIGTAGAFTSLHYLNPTEVTGLYNSNSGGGTAFYNHRLSERHYVGASYQYSRILTYPQNAQIETQTNYVLGFYTIYLKPTFSVSMSAGPEQVRIFQPPSLAYRSWSPALTASTSWQGRHTNVAASYGRIITSGGGLVGAYLSNNASASARWQVAHTWTLGATAAYAINKNVTPSFFQGTPGGHTVSETIAVQHPISERFNLEMGYTYLHQSYSDIAVISNAPNINRVFVSVNYQLARPLGR
jgi:hypothetical protein